MGILDKLRALWAVIMTPSAFLRDPYGELTNQMSHTLAGAMASGFLAWIGFAILGEWPERWVIIGLVSVFYAGVIELAIQGWKKNDSCADWAMFTIGGMAIVWPFSEVVTAEGIFLHFDPMRFLVVMSVWAIILLIRVTGRL